VVKLSSSTRVSVCLLHVGHAHWFAALAYGKLVVGISLAGHVINLSALKNEGEEN
jgi:hypothetical protein